ncbi:MAG: RAD55 family ATPase [Nitrososphaerota archaeon]
MTVQSTQPKKLSTGIEGLDVLLSGGLPEKRTILVLGGPGSGKSILCTQFLKEGLEKYNEGTIYVSLDYSKKAFMHDMLQFGWDFDMYEKNGRFLFLEGSAIRRLPQATNSVDAVYAPEDLTLEDLIDLLSLHIEKIGAKRVVIDDLTALTFRFPDDAQRRSAILSLIESLSTLDVTTVIISEATVYDINRGINTEEYLADGVIGMYLLKDGTRAIQVSKMRGVQVDNKPHPYTIVDKVGIEVYPTETIFSEK